MDREGTRGRGRGGGDEEAIEIEAQLCALYWTLAQVWPRRSSLTEDMGSARVIGDSSPRGAPPLHRAPCPILFGSFRATVSPAH